MRWSEYLGALPGDEAVALVNGLTSACLRAAWAVRCMHDDAPAATVLPAWRDTATALRRTRRRLAGLPSSDGAEDQSAVPNVPPDIRWQTVLHQQGPQARTLLNLLTTVVDETCQAATCVAVDGELASVRCHVIAAVAALADARALIARST